MKGEGGSGERRRGGRGERGTALVLARASGVLALVLVLALVPVLALVLALVLVLGPALAGTSTR